MHDAVATVSVSAPSAIVTVTLVRVWVPELVQLEQNVVAFICSENVTVPRSPASTVPAMFGPLAMTTPVTVGCVVSMVTTTLPLETDTLPAASVAVAVKVWAPVISVDAVIDQLPPVAVAVPTCVTPSYSLTVAPASAVPVIVGVATLVRLSPWTPPL